jgi:group I intron endonuclease
MKSGVYTITNIINNKIYVGSSTISVNTRLKQHKSQLKNNKHSNRILQNSYNKYGEENFIFEILEECLPEHCLGIEQYWMNMLDVCNRKYGYNINVNASNRRGCKLTTNQKNHLKNINKNIIYQYSLSGEFIREWNSVKEASASLKISQNQILKVINKKDYHYNAKGFLFLRKKNKILEYTERYNSKKTKIYQYDLQGNFIKEWNGFQEILNVFKWCLYKKDLLKNKTLGGFQWKLYKQDKISPYICNIKYNIKPVNQYDLNFNFIKTFKSVSDAAKELNTSSSFISGVCKNKYEQAFGFKFKYI